MTAAAGHRRGLTLLETLAALTILAGLTAAVGAALGPMTRAARVIEPDRDALGRAFDVLRRDVEHAARTNQAVRPDDAADRLDLLTANAPADNSAGGSLENRGLRGRGRGRGLLRGGWREVRWEREDDALIRTEQPIRKGEQSRRVVLRGVAAFDVDGSHTARDRTRVRRWTITVRLESGEARRTTWEQAP